MSRGLGKGFGALLPDDLSTAYAPVTGDVVKTVPIAEVFPNPDQPRKDFDPEALAELADSIREQGIIQPILAEKVTHGYRIVAGERRWRAAKLAGLAEVPVLVRSFSEEARMEIALIENVQRSDLTAMEEARAYQRLMESFGLTQDVVAKKVGKQRSTIANALRLLNLTPEMQWAIDTGELTAGHARAILSVATSENRSVLFREILNLRLSVRQAEERAGLLNNPPPAAPKASPPAPKRMLPELADLQQQFIDRLGTKVEIKGDGSKGRIEIAYYSGDDLNRVYEILLQLDTRG
ncbi:MAG: ParB/RepB/Spo0J family partition protein [Spirochaetales bacterium]